MDPVLIIKTGTTFSGTRETFGDFEDWILHGMSCSGLNARVVNVRLGESVPEGGISGVVIAGAHAMVTDQEPWSERLAPWIRRWIDNRTPLLGICFGHQLVAHAMGGRVGEHPRGPEIGTIRISIRPEAATDFLFGDQPSEFSAHVTHWQTVLRLPAGAVCLAESDIEPHHAFRIGPCAWGVQFHPEFCEDVMRAYVDAQAVAMAARGLDAAAVRAGVRPTSDSAGLLNRFYKFARFRGERSADRRSCRMVSLPQST